jgi:hypothetical protein
VETTTTFVPFAEKGEKQADGSVLVRGIATDPSLDSDRQVCDPDWLKTAMPDWFKWGNIREQHSHIAAGVATEHVIKGEEHHIGARIVDPGSVRKLEADVLKGFSIGIANPRIVKDAEAPGGRIVGGQIVEVSLVDRPANPNCRLELAKAFTAMEPGTEVAPDDLSGDLVKVETLIETAPEPVVEGDESIAAVVKAVQKALNRQARKAAKKAAKAAGDAPTETAPDPTADAMRKMRKQVKHLAKQVEALTERLDKAPTPDAGLATKVTALEAAVTKVTKTIIPGAVRTAPPTAPPSVPADTAVRAAYLRKMAAAETDQQVAEGFRILADRLTTT